MRNLPGAARLVLASFLLLPAVAFAADLRIAYIDVGQGDAEVIIAPSGCAAVIDGGPTGSGAAIKAYLRSQGVTQIAFGIVSHYHSDHIGGIDEVAQGSDAIPFTKMYDRGGTYSSTMYTEYANTFSGKRSTVTRGQTFSLCNEVTFEVVSVNGNGVSTTDENGLSVGVKVSYGGFRALFGGDLGYGGSYPAVEQTLIGHVGAVDVYKVHHHCSSTSSYDQLLAELVPTVSVIEVGVGNTYGHPTSACLTRLQAVNSTIYETEDPATSSYRGNVVLTSTTGANYVVTQQGTSAVYTSKGGGGGGGGETVLTDGVPLPNQSGAAGSQAFYKITVPAGQSTLTVSTSGGTGDVDLYVKFGARPTTSTYDCRPYLSGNGETCTFTNPAAGDWYIMLNAYSAYSGVTVLADYAANAGDPYLTNGVAVTNISGAASSQQYWRLAVPAGKTQVVFTMSGGTGDADLYVRSGSRPTTTTYNCRPYLSGNNETCTISNPAAGDWYVMIRGYSAFSGVSLKGQY